MEKVMAQIRIRYQSYVDYENGSTYWDHLRTHLANIVDDGTEVEVIGITPFNSYAFFVGHFQDAGLYEARSAVDIPVVALGEATMLYSCQLGQQSGIVTINPRFIPWFHHQIGKYGLRERVTGVHAMTFEPGQIMAGFESEDNFENVMRLFTEQAKPLVESGCDVLIPGGGIPMLLFAKEHNHNVNGAPVINGIPIVTKKAEMAVKLRRLTGLHISRTSDYVQPPPEIIAEFLNHPKGL